MPGNTQHHLSHSTELFYGGAYFPPAQATNKRRGAPMSLPYRHVFGAVEAADADLIVDAATSTELPNATTIIYTTDDDGSSPFDNADTPAPTTIVTAAGETVSVWPLDVPRNLVAAVTHGSAVVAMTIVVTGYDRWREKVVEQFDITAGGGSKTDVGNKALAFVESVAITSAGNATTNTLNLGSGTKLGLPYKLANVYDLLSYFAGAVEELASVTIAAADTTAATATTGDVRGTVTPNTPPDGTDVHACWFLPADGDPTQRDDLAGVAQYAG